MNSTDTLTTYTYTTGSGSVSMTIATTSAGTFGSVTHRGHGDPTPVASIVPPVAPKDRDGATLSQ